MTTREGLVRLHVRVLSARTGQILFAKQLDGLYKDAIANELVSALKEFHYSFYSYQYPAYKGE
jgi:TolB-like protein